MNGSPLDHWHASHGAVRVAGNPEPLRYGDVRTEYEAVKGAVGLFDASSARDRLLITGDDRIEFVQGLCTNDVEALPVGGSCEAAFITPKGRLIADVRITKLDDALLLDAEAGRGAALQEELAKYRIHEKAEWSDASADLSAIELWGPGAAGILGEMSIPDGTSKAVDLGENAFLTVGTPFGVVLYAPAGAASVVADALVERAAVPVGREAIEVRRIELGLGRYGIDWNETTNPLEAGLDRALNYKKGCYVGQEVVAKATYIGHVNRRLVCLAWEGEAVPAGTALLGGKSPGRITSCARVPGESRVVALGVVRRESAAAGTHHRLGEGGPEAVVTGYPFASREKPV
jgi:folate-binding protein YgfZ